MVELAASGLKRAQRRVAVLLDQQGAQRLQVEVRGDSRVHDQATHRCLNFPGVASSRSGECRYTRHRAVVVSAVCHCHPSSAVAPSAKESSEGCAPAQKPIADDEELQRRS